jgi:hydrogenase expression/formation protein HypC
MCLGVPGEILSIEENDGSRMAKVSFGGALTDVSLDLVPDAGVGDYVIVHVGFALSKLDEEEASGVFDLLRKLEEP